jgi:hypothetical protein
MIEYKPNINFKIWRVYPPDSDILDLDHKDWPRGRAAKRAFTFCGFMGGRARRPSSIGFRETSRGSVKKSQTNKTDKKNTAIQSAPENATSAPTKPFERVDLKALREQITNLVGNHAVGMVNKTIAEADKGHYLAMKYLFEMVGLCPATNSGGGVEEEADSLAKILLERLNIPQPSTEVTGEGGADAARLASDTVK